MLKFLEFVLKSNDINFEQGSHTYEENSTRVDEALNVKLSIKFHFLGKWNWHNFHEVMIPIKFSTISIISSSLFLIFRPPILFQRQSRNLSSVQVEIPIENSLTSSNLINGNSSLTTEYPEHQSTTSSQTITTIASINRLSDNEFSSMPTSSETVADVTSLIKPNSTVRLELTGRDGYGVEKDFDIISHENLNCNNSRRSSSRCITETRSDRNINRDEDSVSITDHKKAENHCKNVNISNTNELNKALISIVHSSPSLRDTLSGSNGKRCEMGVR